MAGLCEGGNEPPGSLKVSNGDGVGGGGGGGGEVRPRIRHRLPDICLTVGENLCKKLKLSNQPKRESNPSPSATPDRQASALAD
ncbi:hypothetical protein ANN_12477 [Periplaneta americana]|uniref:Uncharacterized protein n=1 Tax=Periplaneta americana TaxID=6978 RepID=A0ABQ8TIL1_PERAM|nr:hypothetical protein ANN_12477 [Periplaneta americana]